jgi:hypothetical protein
MSQADLFGDPSVGAPRYVPKPEHVRNALADLLAKLQRAQAWPWPEAVAELHVERTAPYLLGLLADAEEAARWRAQLDAEIARLGPIADAA